MGPEHYVYILTNKLGNVMYIGMTNSLERRLSEHRSGMYPGFTQRYNVNKLVYYEVMPSMEAAYERERTLKDWRRSKKDDLVRSVNPEWRDLSDAW